MPRSKSWSGWVFALRDTWKSLSGGPRTRTAHPVRLRLETLEDRTVLSPVTDKTPLMPPVPSNDVQPADGSVTLHLDAPSYFSDPNGAALVNSSLQFTTNAAHGLASINSTSGQITYNATTGFVGTDKIGFTIADADGLRSNPAYVSIVVTQPNALDDNIDTDAGNPVLISVLDNDSSTAAALDPTSVHVVTNPGHGMTSVNSSGVITYTSAASFSGTDTFTYTVADANGAVSNTATVSVVVNRPQANDDFASTTGTTPVVISVLGNDTDPDGNGMLNPSSVAATTPGHGTAHVNPDGSITYTANANFTGTDTFTYTVTDVNNAVSNAATVTVSVQQSSAGTVINPDTIDTDAGHLVVIDVLANDTSPVGFNAATVTATKPPHGTATADSSGNITYTPDSGFFGTDTFTYTVQDKNGTLQGPGSVSVVVNRPKANDDFNSTDAGNPVTISVLANDTDPDGNGHLVPSSVAVGTGPAHGTAVLGTGANVGEIIYTPSADFSGTDTFTYTVTDDNGAVSNVATVNVVVNRPTANDDFGTTDSGFPIQLSVLDNDTDPDGPGKLDPTSVTLKSNPANGSAHANSDGSITYTSNTGFSGTDTFTYTVTDVNNAVSNVATVTVVVNQPTANPDAVSTNVSVPVVPVVLDVAANDTDPDGNQFLDPKSVTITSGPSHGSVSVDPSTGQVTYTPAAGFSGIDTFNYTIADSHGAVSNPATVSITVLDAGIVSLPAQPTPLIGAPASTAVVDGIYANLLGRRADTIALNDWVPVLQSPGSTQAVVQGILNSPEQRGLEVMSYYHNFLNRDPSMSEVNGWVSDFKSGATEQQVVLGIVTSAEFLSLHPSDDAYVNTLYNVVLGRNAMASELPQWRPLLDSGHQVQVALAIMNSQEALKDVVTAYYSDYLNRTGSSAEVANWLTFLASHNNQLDTVAVAFLTSTEFHQGVISGVL